MKPAPVFVWACTSKTVAHRRTAIATTDICIIVKSQGDVEYAARESSRGFDSATASDSAILTASADQSYLNTKLERIRHSMNNCDSKKPCN